MWCNSAELEFPHLAVECQWLRVVPSLLESLVPAGIEEDGDEKATAATVRDQEEEKAGSIPALTLKVAEVTVNIIAGTEKMCPLHLALSPYTPRSRVPIRGPSAW